MTRLRTFGLAMLVLVLGSAGLLWLAFAQAIPAVISQPRHAADRLPAAYTVQILLSRRLGSPPHLSAPVSHIAKAVTAKNGSPAIASDHQAANSSRYQHIPSARRACLLVRTACTVQFTCRHTAASPGAIWGQVPPARVRYKAR